ncbi:MAG: Flp pilus assembly complex ATPase component TadA [Anaerolineae bacterium]|nr:Flp pilus assembly complex ATPase component TadA [Anaerolineae bacterium]
MPLLNRLTGDANGDNGDNGDNGHREDAPPPTGISPIMPGRTGRPSYSLEALRERIEAQFHEETSDRADILRDLDTEAKRRAMLTEVADYVLTVQAVTLTPGDKANLIDRAYRSLFTFGPLDDLLADDTVTEIAVNGPFDVHVRRGIGPLEKSPAAFADRPQLANTVARVLRTTPNDISPFIETDVTLKGRTARISLIAPPISADYTLTIRLHPRERVTLAGMSERWRAVPPQAADLLTAILRAGHGLLIVGDVGQGKTTLAGALAHTLPAGTTGIAVERAAELDLPPGFTRRTPAAGTPGESFADTIRAALNDAPEWLIVDEIRGDESAAVWDALTRDRAPRCLWVFRGSSQPNRLRSALTMLIRKTQQAIPQDTLYGALARHLPFVAAFKRYEGVPRLSLIAESVLTGEGENTSLAFRPLIEVQDGGWLVTTNRPTRPLDLPAEFWE